VDQTKSHTLSAIVEAPFLDVKGKVTALYLATLTRPPSAEELGERVKFVEEVEGETEQKLRYGDIFWVLLNCSEFVLNH